jgi:hypothetical protein
LPMGTTWGGLAGDRGHRKGQLRVLGSPSARHTKEPRTGGPPGGRGVRGPDFFSRKSLRTYLRLLKPGSGPPGPIGNILASAAGPACFWPGGASPPGRGPRGGASQCFWGRLPPPPTWLKTGLRSCDEAPVCLSRRAGGESQERLSGSGHEVRWPRGTQFRVADWVLFGRLKFWWLRPKPSSR